ncbi:DUF2695 domain-containing protein [Hymenobacter sp. CRA2]|uniref:DUF2695 domain-containing protein n=1 Tax=Hymenobacter sp. CRA2 TaxID=1955620 RepID=UPI00098FE40D|nr:DUF2695 domain-containing protein [Hymenobacter sp. CRA2]OON69010.1 hypothetical protein B0919_09865 [Hymenobacter sp. CRA2]
MLAATEHPRRPTLSPLLRQPQRAALLANLPLTTEQLAELFDYLDQRLSTHSCDDTLGHTRCFAAAQGVAFEPLRQFLSRHGGRCDCAVRAKVQEQYAGIL